MLSRGKFKACSCFWNTSKIIASLPDITLTDGKMARPCTPKAWLVIQSDTS